MAQTAIVEELADAAQVVAASWDDWAADVPALRFIAGARNNRTVDPQPMAGLVAWAAPRIRAPTAAPLDEAMPTAALLSRLQPGDRRHALPILRTRKDPDTDAALRTAAAAGSGEGRVVALTILGERGVTDHVPAASALLHEEAARGAAARGQASPARLACHLYLEALPPETTLHLARAWFGAPRPLSLVAERILALHAMPDDRPMLETAGDEALATGNMYRLCAVIDALATIGARASLPFVARVYGTAPYSWARRRVVTALIPHRCDRSRKSCSSRRSGIANPNRKSSHAALSTWDRPPAIG